MAARSVSFSDQVRALARGLGFDAVGIARAGPDAALDADFDRYLAFVDAGLHGQMAWLASPPGARRRLDGDEILPGARSVVCLARRYPRDRDTGGLSRSIARYARGKDYHRFMRARVRRVAKLLRSFGTDSRPVRARPLCDEEPLLERAWAVRAGLGFVGKNGMLIVPGLGSMVMLGEVVTDLELDPGGPETGDLPRAPGRRLPALAAEERCGACTRCLDACPTSAFARPFVLDPRRCVSYLTIEHSGEIPVALREGMGDHLFGCDDCQTVCPFNAGAGARAAPTTADGNPFAPLPRWEHTRLEDLLTLDEAGYDALTEGSPLRRAGRAKLARNAALVLGNRGDASALPALRAAGDQHDEASVREAAEWAVGKLRRTGRGMPGY